MAAKEELISALKKNYDTKLFAVELLSKVFGNLLEVSTSIQRPPEEPNNTESKVIERVGVYAKITLEDDVEVLCYEILLKKYVRIDQSKVAIQHYVRKLLTSGQAALINFISPTYKDMWRFTLVAKDSELVNGSIKEKATHPKRYTFLVEAGEDKTNRTLVDRLTDLSVESDKNLDTLREAFAVEKMSKAFFDEYKEHYLNFVQYLTGTRMMRIGSKWEPVNAGTPSAFLKSVFNGDEKNARDFCKKLLGRIVFLYFVQKKKWLGASNTDYEDGSQNFIFELFDETGGDERFFPHGLTELFFNALNKERPDDDYTTQTGRKVKIPYLNGGLFTRDEVDELIHKKGDLMTFPSELFSNPDKRDIPVPKGATVEIKESPYRGFLDFLNAFNFTVYEDSQDDHTVAVDPEMLGHIFENLLEDNKDKGAYYTPKEIVSYMCQESLIEYLKTQLPEIDENALQRLVREKEVSTISKSHLGEVDTKLKDVKICDPAIGSGAFPMGLLQEIFSIREIVSYEIDLPWNPAKAKEDIIQNSIYGVDIEKGAVDIARLRFWLSLVVDRDRPQALPNLDYKIVVGNSLVPKFDGEIIEIDWERKDSVGAGKKFVTQLQETLIAITQKQKKFFDPNLKAKRELVLEIRNLKLDALINQLSFNKEKFQNTTPIKGGFDPTPTDKKFNLDRELRIKGLESTIKRLKKLQDKHQEAFEHFDWRLDFPEILNDTIAKRYGFDIVIGNPPYLRVQGIRDKYPNEVDYYLKKYDSATGRFDLYALFTERSYQLLSKTGVLNFIQPDKWTNADFGNGLRKKLSKKVNRLISFGQSQVFNVSTYSSLIWIQFKDLKFTKYHSIENELHTEVEIQKYLSSLTEDDFSEIDNTAFSEEPWIFMTSKSGGVMGLISAHSNKVSDFFSNVSQGIVSVGDDIFIMEGQIQGGLFKGYSHKTNSTVEIESDLMKPLLRGDDVRKYYPLVNRAYVVYPHFEYDGKTMPYSEEEFKKRFPKAYKYFLPYKVELTEKKIKYKTNSKYWYSLHRSREMNLFKSEKIVTPEISLGSNMTLDTSGFFHNTQVYSLVKKTEIDIDIRVFLAILNSSVTWYYLKSTGAILRGGYFRFKTKYLEPFPIPNMMKGVFEPLIQLVDYLLFISAKEVKEPNVKLMTSYYIQILDGIIYELYFPELLKKYDREVIKHLGDLPELKASMTDDQKMAVCQEVFKRLDDKEHPVRNNIFYMDSIPEIAIIEGKK
ncbi:Eco57I restriction-modification methylase domain-containing protein [Pleomorphovibrio marinus]|uniref:Eco57I restriction-modification methylase domain-containing protein n=1 Tax=Pleomorphovibrio marinus TaxID=2164132 RepID=UPI000E0B45FD|nr:TaqI-like C-terminal specificity domain-containing protein [Pleomorphovibrio marinus]